MNSEKQNVLETITRLFTILTIICYLIGVFAVNSYLYRLGIASLSSPLKPRFIYTGIVVLSSLAFSFFFPAFLIRKIFSRKSKNWLCHAAIFTIPFFVYLGINWLFVILVGNSGVIVLAPYLTIIIVAFYWIGSCITGSVIGLFLQAFFPIFSRIAGIDYWKIYNSNFPKFLVGFLLIPALSLYITFFGHRVYPLIPEQFGGGQPRVAQLWLKSDTPSEIKTALKIESNSTTSASSPATLALLFDEETYYLVGLYTAGQSSKLSDGKTKDGKTLESVVQIDRDVVLGIKLAKDSSKYFLSCILDWLNSIFYKTINL